MRYLLISLLALSGGTAMAADPAPPKTTPLAVNPVVLPTPDVPSQPLGMAADAPSPKAAAKKSRPAEKKPAKKAAKKPSKKAPAKRTVN